MNTKVDEGKLISGKEALIALANGEEVELRVNEVQNWKTAENCVIGHFLQDSFKFRLKPRTISINGIEVPAPFKPKEGEMFWYLDASQYFGYSNAEYDPSDYEFTQFGAWRTEEKIKQVIAALRQVFGGSHDN